MNFPPPNPVDHPGTGTGTGIGAGAGTGAGTNSRSQFAWGPSSQQQATRRGLPSISTALNSTSSRSNRSSSPSRSTFSPVNPPYTSVPPASSRQILTRTPSASSTSSPFWPLQAGPQHAQGSQLPSSSRSRNTTSASSSQAAASAAALPTLSQGGGGGGSSGGAAGATRLARDSPSLSQSSVGSPGTTSNPASASSGGQSGSLSKIVIAQVFLLLSTIKEDGDKAKWDSQADQIRKLIESNGMEVYTKFFRRLLQSNASQIFPSFSRSGESSGSYNLLVAEVQKLTQDPEQAYKIAESIDTSENDIFRDFDLSKFMDHFHLDPLAKTALALACKKASKPDLRNKADAILASSFQSLLVVLTTPPLPPEDNPQDESAPFIVTIIDRLLQDPPRNWREEDRSQLLFALSLRYQRLDLPEPAEVAAVMHLAEILSGPNGLVRLIQRTGPKATASVEACKEMLATIEGSEIGYHQVASALLYMVITEHGQAYNPGVFVTALRQHRAGQRLDWQDVVGAFDREGLQVTKHQFLGLFNALFPLAKEFENLDIQLLWGGHWNHKETQLSFVSAFLSLTVEELDASTIPRLRRAFKMEEFEDASEEIQAYAAKAVRHPWVSLDAATALLGIIFRSQDAYNYALKMRIPDIVINANTDIVVCSASAIPKPWTQLQDMALKQLVYPFILKRLVNHGFVLHALGKHDVHWLLDKVHDQYLADRTRLEVIYEQAVEHGWVDALLRIQKELAIDLAMLCYSRGSFDLEAWLQQCADASPEQFSEAVGRFLLTKASAELDCQKDGAEPQTVPLTLKAVFTTVSFLSAWLPEEYQVALQRACIQAYPRLINYGEGFDDIIDANSTDGHALSPETDARMQEHYKDMYGNTSTPTDIVQLLIRYKTSRDPAEQDLFACMIHGLFDEYNCFADYPLEALAPTAVLFGGMIKHNVLPGFALGVALFMVLESVERYSPEDGMYKFGLQALGNCIDRLSEWPGFCKRLISVPQLHGTQVYRKAEEVVHQRGAAETAETNGNHRDGAPMTNGDLDPLYVSHIPSFTCLHVDPPIGEDLYEEPDESLSDRVLFALNNLSERNMESRLRGIKDVLEEKHHRWFATHLVEQRVKSEPNYQKLYLDMLDVFDQRTLWTEVLRETYVSVIRMLNAESTMYLSTERAHLKNLGAWLGLLTLARNKPIKFKNISFKDLLIEGHDTQRLMVVVPFTCKVVAHAAKSTVFKPPNAWTMEIVRLLVELYHFGDLRLNLKFEIEVLCKELGLDYKTIEPSDSIRSRPIPEEDFEGSTIVDGLEGFNGLPAMMGLNRTRAANPRYSLNTIFAGLPDVDTLLVFPPSLDSVIGAHRFKQIFGDAARKSLAEIIQPVVERSVTIAAIATSQVVIKDFATEPDEGRLRQSAHNVVKALAGSLGLVTCKEPLRASIANNIRVMTAGEELPLAEGILTMFVNDNLDAICGLVEQAAETQSLTEIDLQIEDAVQARLRHRASQPDQRFEEPALSTWSRWIQPPYQQQGPLNREQMTVYEEFGRQVRPLSTHVGTISQDSGRQMQDAIQDHFPSVHHLPTPAEPPTTQRNAIQQPQPRLPAAPPVQAPSHELLNGYVENQNIGDRIQDLMADMRNAAHEVPEYRRLRYLRGNHPVNEIYNRLVQILDNLDLQRDVMMLNVAQKSASLIYQEGASRLEIEVFVALLSYVCQASATTARLVGPWLAQLADDRLFYIPVTVALIKEKLMSINRVDSLVAKLMYQRRIDALHFLGDLIEELLLIEEPIALRVNFARSLEASTAWLTEDPDLELAEQISNKLRGSAADDTLQVLHAPRSANTESQLMYVFDEWVELQDIRGAEKALTAFVHQLHKQLILEDRDACSLFFRLCIDRAVASFINEAGGTLDAYAQPRDSFLQADALARLIVCLVISQDTSQADQGSTSKAAYLESILALVVLLLSHHHQTSRKPFPQKLYYRIFASIINEFQRASGRLGDVFDDIILVLGKAVLAMQPGYLPKFAFAWLALVSHPTLMPELLTITDHSGNQIRQPDKEGWLVTRQRLDLYVLLIQAMLAYGCEVMEPGNTGEAAREIYRGVLRVLLVLHHDFPEFLVENHFSLCNFVPARSTQIRNLIVSAFPSSFPELPDPFTAGLKVDRLEEIRKSPTIRGDVTAPLRQANIKTTIDNILASSEFRERDVQTVINSIHNAKQQKLGFAAPSGSVETAILNALVLYVGSIAITSAGSKGPSFSPTSSAAMLLSKLTRGLNPESRFHLISAIVNQLRYPNSHTHYFSYALLHLFGTSVGAGENGTIAGDSQDDALQAEIQQQITTVLIERLIVHRPHPWGLIITLLEILKNPSYAFWELDFMKAAPEIERYFSALFQLRGQSPRNMS